MYTFCQHVIFRSGNPQQPTFFLTSLIYLSICVSLSLTYTALSASAQYTIYISRLGLSTCKRPERKTSWVCSPIRKISYVFDFIFDAEQEYAIIAVETAVAGISILSLLGAGNIICCQKNNNDKERHKRN